MDFVLNMLVLLSPALLGLLGWGFMKLNQLIAAKVSNEQLKGMLIRLDNSVESAVRSVAQAYVDPLKKADKFDDAAKAEAKAKAIEAAKSYLGPKGIDELKKIMGWDSAGADQQLANKIESEVRKG